MKSAQFKLYFQIHISNENVVRNTCFLIQSIKEKKIHIYGQHSTKERYHTKHTKLKYRNLEFDNNKRNVKYAFVLVDSVLCTNRNDINHIYGRSGSIQHLKR